MTGAREVEHLVGLLLGTEDDWPRAYDALLGVIGPVRDADGREHAAYCAKPYDGGAWRGVSRVRNAAELHCAYDESGEMLMHLQAAVDGFDVFARALSIGAETMVMRFDPDAPMHERYRVEHGFLEAGTGDEVVTISKTINAFFRWEFNSCEVLVKDGEVYPIDYANACPDVAVTSLHYYFPWAMRALVKWTVFCRVTGRRPRLDLDTRAYFEIGDRDDVSYEQKLAAYGSLADSYFDAARYQAFCDIICPQSTNECTTGSLARPSSGYWSTPSEGPTPTTSRSASSRTSAA